MEKVTSVSGEDSILSSICGDFDDSIFLFLETTLGGFDLKAAGVHFEKQALFKILEDYYAKIDNEEEFENNIKTCFIHGNITNIDSNSTICNQLTYIKRNIFSFIIFVFKRTLDDILLNQNRWSQSFIFETPRL